MFGRLIEPVWRKKFTAPYIHIVFGARQTGKSTLLKHLLPEAALWLDLSDPEQRFTHLRDPGRFARLCRALPSTAQPALVVIDEAQHVPAIFDAVQHLYDLDHTRWRFVLCGSSARRLQRTGANLLPGRAILHQLYALTALERPFPETGAGRPAAASPLSFGQPGLPPDLPAFPSANLLERLTFGELPGVAVAPEDAREDLLRTYSYVYLEEEIRREALVRNWTAFARFLQLAASESGQALNYARIARDAGVALPTVKGYYQLLEDMSLGFRVTAFSGSRRKTLLSTERFFLFDVGVRHAAAGLSVQSATVVANPGPVFEQWVGSELWKRLRYLGTGSLHYLRTKGGAEVDFIVDRGGQLTPIDVKWTDNPSPSDARHLVAFLREHAP